jgi:hypothetical protein
MTSIKYLLVYTLGILFVLNFVHATPRITDNHILREDTRDRPDGLYRPNRPNRGWVSRH